MGCTVATCVTRLSSMITTLFICFSAVGLCGTGILVACRLVRDQRAERAAWRSPRIPSDMLELDRVERDLL